MGRRAAYEATFDHGGEGYGLWLDPAVTEQVRCTCEKEALGGPPCPWPSPSRPQAITIRRGRRSGRPGRGRRTRPAESAEATSLLAARGTDAQPPKSDAWGCTGRRRHRRPLTLRWSACSSGIVAIAWSSSESAWSRYTAASSSTEKRDPQALTQLVLDRDHHPAQPPLVGRRPPRGPLGRVRTRPPTGGPRSLTSAVTRGKLAGPCGGGGVFVLRAFGARQGICAASPRPKVPCFAPAALASLGFVRQPANDVSASSPGMLAMPRRLASSSTRWGFCRSRARSSSRAFSTAQGRDLRACLAVQVPGPPSIWSPGRCRRAARAAARRSKAGARDAVPADPL